MGSRQEVLGWTPIPLVELLEAGLSAGAGRDSGRAQHAGAARAAVAHRVTLVVLTVQRPLTDGLAAVVLHARCVRSAQNFLHTLVHRWT